MGAIVILPWIFLVLGTSVMLLAIWWVVRSLLPLSGTFGEARCASCKYPVAEHNSFRCPECGSDLRHVGITSPLTSARRGVILPLAVLSWVMLIVLATGSMWLWVTLPAMFLVSSFHSAKPSSGPLTLVETWVEDTPSRERPSMLLARLTGPKGQASLEVDLKNQDCLLVGIDGRSSDISKYNGTVTLASLNALTGADLPSEDLLDQSRELDKFIRSAISAPQGSHEFSTDGALRSLPAWGGPDRPRLRMLDRGIPFEWLVLLGGALVGLLGIFAIVRRRRSVLRSLQRRASADVERAIGPTS